MAKSEARRTGIYPGTFDPITLGHIDIVKRASRVVDRLIIAVAKNSGKGPLFDTKERVAMVKAEVLALASAGIPNIEVLPFENLLMHFAEEVGASVIIRGLRAASDFEYEIQMAAMNGRTHPQIETVFLSATEGTQFISSRFVKEIAALGGSIRPFVSPRTAKRLEEKLGKASSRRKVATEVRD